MSAIGAKATTGFGIDFQSIMERTIHENKPHVEARIRSLSEIKETWLATEGRASENH